MAAYSAISFGHANSRLLKTLIHQVQKLAVTSRAFYTDQLGPFIEKICSLSGFEMEIPMNTGAEAVETAIKVARRWSYETKGIKENQTEIIVAENNFHGRTTTIISFSTESDYRRNFGPFTLGFKYVPFGDGKALEKAIPIRELFLLSPSRVKLVSLYHLKDISKKYGAFVQKKTYCFCLMRFNQIWGEQGKCLHFNMKALSLMDLFLEKL